MTTQAERRAATRTRLIAAAREHFARDGYHATHTNSILEQAGVSRGALYHHFPSKQDLFEAVFVDISNETIQQAGRHGMGDESPLENLISACLAWLRAVCQAEVATILLDQGPQVLGWKRARDLEATTSLALMKRALKLAIDAGEIEVPCVELAARLINALLAEAALAALHGEPETSSATQEAAIRQWIEGLRTDGLQPIGASKPVPRPR